MLYVNKWFQVHELEITKIEMESEAVLKEHEIQRRDLMIMRYDRHRSLCEEIIRRQKMMLEGGCIYIYYLKKNVHFISFSSFNGAPYRTFLLFLLWFLSHFYLVGFILFLFHLSPSPVPSYLLS